MKPYFLLPVFLLISAGKSAQDQYVLSKEYTVTIDGTSNLRDWKENVGNVSGAMEARLNTDGSIDLSSIHICMEVMSIKSDMGRVMDNKTYEALKAGDHPEILFTVTTPLKLNLRINSTTTIPVKGSLSLAGVCRPVTMQMTALEFSQGNLRLEGYENLKMTDFGVRPPTALFGTMHASPDITIHFKTNFINQSICNNLKN